ncbi:sensor histidine kinase [Leucobacter allii]|uniref:sensor histidine kinase n=1 Tax=Leucobacter allii TaxID=2932247 RepID=UPI001FD311E4|nr:sensor histidine kinase [Leucobacter allii]UOR01258.1 sensor histidine kinase [Leucobacter allii]
MSAPHDSASWTRPPVGRAGLRADLGLALLLAFASLTTALLYARTGVYSDPAEPWVWVLGLGLATLPLAVRRRYPVPVAIVVAAGFFICGQFGVPEVLIINITLFCALYTVGAWERRRALALWARLGIGATMIGWLVVSLIVASSEEDAFPGVSRSGIFSAYATYAVIQIITNLLYFGGAFFFGERSWRAARTQARLEAQGRELELERQTSAAQAVALDRIAIARELHDVVAHHVSVMGIQAAAARRLLERDPDRAAAALEVVETSAGDAVTELRRLVGTLRTPEREGDAPTTVGVAQLPALVAEAQSAGTPTTLIVAGTPRPLPMLVDVALYRVVQEALTNVRKHAGRGAIAEVRLRFGSTTVEVEVTDDGVRQGLGAREPGSGLGLRGMRERIGAVGGTVAGARRERGGFLVRAAVPTSAAADPAPAGLATGAATAAPPAAARTATAARSAATATATATERPA